MAIDVPEAVYEFLKDDAAAATVRALLVVHDHHVVETGDLNAELLDELETTRRSGGPTELALCIAVQDAGEDLVRKGLYQQYVIIRIYDRLVGYSNIRAVRKELLTVMKEFHCVPYGTAQVGRLKYSTRTGHQWDRSYAVEFEAITYVATVARDDSK